MRGTGGTNGVAGSGAFSGSNGSPGHGLGGDIANGSGTFILQNTILAPTSTGTNVNAYDASGSPITRWRLQYQLGRQPQFQRHQPQEYRSAARSTG